MCKVATEALVLRSYLGLLSPHPMATAIELVERRAHISAASLHSSGSSKESTGAPVPYEYPPRAPAGNAARSDSEAANDGTAAQQPGSRVLETVHFVALCVPLFLAGASAELCSIVFRELL
jgi:hypothetical protein